MRGRASRLVPCTPLGIVELLARCGVAVAGKSAVVVGDSNVVGTPLAALLRDRGAAAVTICHRLDYGAAVAAAVGIAGPGLSRAPVTGSGADGAAGVREAAAAAAAGPGPDVLGDDRVAAAARAAALDVCLPRLPGPGLGADGVAEVGAGWVGAPAAVAAAGSSGGDGGAAGAPSVPGGAATEQCSRSGCGSVGSGGSSGGTAHQLLKQITRSCDILVVAVG